MVIPSVKRFVDWNEGVTWVISVAARDTSRAVVPVRACQAFMADATDILQQSAE